MSSSSDPVDSLREALRFSPNNVPLRRHLAETLQRAGRLDEAEEEFRQAIARAPKDAELNLALAQLFHQRGKSSHAHVIVENLLRESHPAADVHLLHCRLLVNEGEIARAVAAYRNAIEADPEAADDELAERLGIDADLSAEVVDGRVRLTDEAAGGGSSAQIERSRVKFADVGGMDAVKEEIRMKIIYPLQHVEMFKAYGKSIGGGILLYGPPGCGKTHLARATAGEIDAGFLAIGINDVLDMWHGNSEKKLHEIFEQARAHKPCVLFFDEVDALGASRSDMKQSAGRQLINQFLAELDGVKDSNDGVLILAATNAPWHLDSAFRRPGRFDRLLFVPPPDAPARSEILRILAKEKPTKDVDYDKLGKISDGLSGADLKGALDQAVEAKLREAMKSGQLKPLATADLQAAIKASRPSTKEWFSTAKNYALYSNQGGVYDDILKYLKMT